MILIVPKSRTKVLLNSTYKQERKFIMKKKVISLIMAVMVLGTVLVPTALAVSDYYTTRYACEMYTAGSFNATVRATLRSGTCIQKGSATTSWLYGTAKTTGAPGYGKTGYVYANYTTYTGTW